MLKTGDERTVLEAFLDDLRRLLELQIEDLTEDEARASLVPSKTTPLGIVQHAAAVERFFFQRALAGRSEEEIAGLSDGTDVSWNLDEAATVASVLEGFREACEVSREVASHFDLDAVAAHGVGRGPLTLRWIYARMIEELGRHSGHADILREQIIARRGSASNWLSEQ